MRIRNFIYDLYVLLPTGSREFSAFLRVVKRERVNKVNFSVELAAQPGATHARSQTRCRGAAGPWSLEPGLCTCFLYLVYAFFYLGTRPDQ